MDNITFSSLRGYDTVLISIIKKIRINFILILLKFVSVCFNFFLLSYLILFSMVPYSFSPNYLISIHSIGKVVIVAQFSKDFIPSFTASHFKCYLSFCK